MIKRIGIFSIDNLEYSLGNEIFFLLKEINKCLDRLFIACNGMLQKNDREKISIYADGLYENIFGYDANRWQYVLCNIIRNMDKNYDEIVLFNDSFFGPIYPFCSVFEKMQFRDVDFWGLTSGRNMKMKRKQFLQTYFMVFRKSAFLKIVFWKFWQNLPIISNLNEYENLVECGLTDKFEKKGLRWCVCSDIKELEPTNKEHSMNHMLLSPLKMIKEKELPILSKHAFIIKREVLLNYNNCSEISNTMEYIKKYTDYDEMIIYSYFIKRYNIYDLKLAFNMNYILHTCNNWEDISRHKIAVYAHLYYEDIFEESLSFLCKLPHYVDIYITTDCHVKKEKIERILLKTKICRYKVFVVESRGREWSAFLIAMGKYLYNYEYFCMIHDKKSSQMFYESVGRTFSDILWGNMLGDVEYIKSIIRIFEDHPEIGLLVPPEVYHGTYFNTATNYWTICFEETKKICRELGIDIPLDEDKPPIALGGAFWCRTIALERLLSYSFKYTDFQEEPLPVDGTFNHALERVIPYVVQYHGYYTGTLMSDTYAATDIANKQFIIRNIMKRLSKVEGLSLTTLEDTLNTLENLASKRGENE